MNVHDTELALIADLKVHPRNYRSHPPDQLEHIKKSIEEHGFYRNVVIAEDGTILAGHGVVEACQALKLDSVPVVRLAVSADSPQALKVLTGDNTIGHLGFNDDRVLTDILRELAEDDLLLGTGFDDSQLAALLMVTRTSAEIADFDAAAEWVGMPDYQNEEEQHKLVITFPTTADRVTFAESVGLRIDMTGKTWSTRWPFTERTDLTAVKFEG